MQPRPEAAQFGKLFHAAQVGVHHLGVAPSEKIRGVRLIRRDGSLNAGNRACGDFHHQVWLTATASTRASVSALWSARYGPTQAAYPSPPPELAYSGRNEPWPPDVLNRQPENLLRAQPASRRFQTFVVIIGFRNRVHENGGYSRDFSARNYARHLSVFQKAALILSYQIDCPISNNRVMLFIPCACSLCVFSRHLRAEIRTYCKINSAARS